MLEELWIEEKLIPYTTDAVITFPEFPNQTSPGLSWKSREYSTKTDVVKDQTNVSGMNKVWHEVAARRKVELPDVCLFVHAQVSKKNTN